MVYKYLIAIAALITVAMLISFLPGHIKQNTAITSIKGFGTYIVNDNGTNFILINGTGTTTNLTLPPTNKFYYSVSLIGTGCSISGSSPTLINDFYYNNQNSETDFPSNEYLYRANNNALCSGYAGGSAQTLANNTFVNTLAQKNNRNYANEPSNIGMTTFFVGTNTSFVNGNATATYGSNFILLPIQKGEAVLFLQGNYASGETPTIPSTYFNCPYQVFVQKGANENPSTFSICYSVYTGTANLSGFTQSTTAILIQQQQTLTFSSTFSYISSSGVVPACYYNNPYKPLVYVNGTLESVTENSFKLINTSGGLARYDSVYGFGGHNYRNASGPSYQILPNGQLNKPDLWITVPNSVSYIDTALDDEMYTGGGSPIFSTLLFNPAQLSQATLFYVNQSSIITKVGQIETAVDYLTGAVRGASYTQVYANGSIEQLGKPVFSFTALLSNSTRLLYSNITLDIRIPTNFSTDNISQIRDPNLTISYGDIVPNSDYYFYIMPAAYYKEIAAHAANDTYILGSNSTHSGIVYTIPLNKSQIQLVKDTNGFINLHVPAVLVFNLNNTNPAGGYYNNVNKTFTAAYYAATYKMSYEIAAPQYTVSLLNAGSKINVTYDSGNTTIMSVYNSKENMSYLDTLSGNNYNSNILLWSYNLEDITYNLEFTSLLNSKLWTSNSIVNYAGKNYTIGSNGYINIPVPAGSTINFIDYVFYNTGYKKVQYTNFVTVPYNPCDPITNYAYSLSNTANINGTIIGTVTGTGQNKTGTGSSGPSVTPPSNITSLSYWEYQLKQWGLLFGSIIVMGLIAFKFGVDKKGVQNPQVMAIAAIIFVALNLFGLAEGLGNIYITGILVFLAAIIMFEMLLKIFHRGGN